MVGPTTMRPVAFILVLALLALSAGAEELEVPFEVVPGRNAIVVDVKVNGVRRVFLLDTGASHTIVSPESLSLSPVDLQLAVFRRNRPGIEGEAMWGQAESLRLGVKTWRDRRVVVMNFKKVREVYGRRIDGLLGQDILLEFDRVELDFKGRRLRLADATDSFSD